jgi:hypothetical protein
MYHGACQLRAIVPHESEFSNGQQNGHNGVYLAAVDTLNYVMVFMWVGKCSCEFCRIVL